MSNASFPADSLTFAAKTVAGACLLLMAADACAAPELKIPDPRENRRVMAYLNSKDCPGAVSAMKEGIKAHQPDVMLLSASLIEDGVCMKSDWDKAEKLYLMAAEHGSPTAMDALVAGLAAPGRDNGRALWYAAQRMQALPAYCRPNADPVKDPEGFNQGLERMPPRQFKQCVYMTGVFFDVLARARFPGAALQNRVQGTARMTFKPSDGTIEWKFTPSADRSPGNRWMGQAQFDDEGKIDRLLLDYMIAKGKFALARYARPEGIDPAIVIKVDFDFTII